ncbi:MAG: hypothetical protein KatS3mg087_1911 [Patescibacteria group bacterium]|nr:MAG: hypothetical protein KatS3mg087_1911 [Patescibacteria group bacterium]
MSNRLPDTLTFVFFGVVVGALGYATLHTQKGRQLKSDVINVVDDFIALAEMVFDEQVSYDNTLSCAYDFMNSTVAKIDSYMSSERVSSEDRAKDLTVSKKSDEVEEVSMDFKLLNKLGKKSYRADKTYSIMTG